ncbi:MAG: AbrB/MazE/SpoVT family DNA-binding domain-containing protein [Syntrophobacteraceae bacterium]
MQIEYKNIDPKHVVNEIRNGRSLESVQKMFGIKFKSEVQDLYLRGLMELGEIPQVEFNRPPAIATFKESLPERSTIRRRQKPVPVIPTPKPVMMIKTANFRTIGQSGSITLNKALLIEQLGFEVGDSFEIFREDDRVILKKGAVPIQ